MPRQLRSSLARVLADLHALLAAQGLEWFAPRGRPPGHAGQRAGRAVRLRATARERLSIVAVLFARGLTPTAAEQSRILATSDVGELARLLAIAATCIAVGEIFAD